MVSLMGIESNSNILLIVEGKRREVDLFKRILVCFPEIQLNTENIIVYNTNIWSLNNSLINNFGDDWYLEEIDFLGYIKSLNPNLERKKITDIFLVFDYERQDPNFNNDVIEYMLRFFNNSTDNGQLYINYPMVEAYKHLKKPLPDYDFLNRKCFCNDLKKYKEIVGNESCFSDLRKIERNDFCEFVIHNLCKASYIVTGSSELSEKEARTNWSKLNMFEILEKQNINSTDNENGFVYILCTCLFFIPNYNSNLIFKRT